MDKPKFKLNRKLKRAVFRAKPVRNKMDLKCIRCNLRFLAPAPYRCQCKVV